MFRLAGRFAICMVVFWGIVAGTSHLLLDHTGSTANQSNHTWDMITGKAPIDTTDGGRLAAVVHPYLTEARPPNKLESLRFNKGQFGDINSVMGSKVVDTGYSDTYDSFQSGFLSQVNQAAAGQSETLYKPDSEVSKPLDLYNNHALMLTTLLVSLVAAVIIAAWWVDYSVSTQSTPYQINKPEVLCIAATAALGFGLVQRYSILTIGLSTLAFTLCILATLVIFKKISEHRKPDVIRELESLQRILIKQAVTFQRDALLDRITKAIAVATEMPAHEAREISISFSKEIEPILKAIEDSIADRYKAISKAHQDLRKIETPELVLQDSIPAQYR